MFMDKTVEIIVNLEKKGVKVFLTEAGYVEFFKSIKEDEVVKFEENVG